MTPHSNEAAAVVRQAISLHQQGRLPEAEALYNRALTIDARDFDALHMLGIIRAQRNQLDEAEAYLRKALSVDQSVVQCWHNYGTILAKLGKFKESIDSYEAALRRNSNYPPLYLDYGNSLFAMQRYQDALLSYERAVAFFPKHADAWCGLGNAQLKLRRYAQALASFDKALSLNAQLANSWLGRGNVLLELDRCDEASRAYDRALAIKPDLAQAWQGWGNLLAVRREYAQALAAYDKALALQPGMAEAWQGRGNIFTRFKKHAEAFAAYERALAIKPELAGAWQGRAALFADLDQLDNAMAGYERALVLDPDMPEAWQGRGSVLSRFKQHKEALMCFEKALQNKPNLEFAEGNRLHEKLLLCDWSDLDADIERLLSATRKGTPTEPFHLLSIPATPGDLLTAARRFVTDRFPISHPAQRQRSAHHDRIQIAYLSFDFRAHPVADLIAGLFEEHDKLRFEVTAISVGPDDGSEVRQRIKAACEHFIDAQRQGDEEIVGLIQQRGIDIAVDLNGFTQGTRMGALLRRPAALQVNYLGYPGTLGSSQFDYIIVDDTIVPEHECGFYTEKCVWLPHTFQVNDRRRAIAESTPSRRECGLPEAGAVFCCFNTNYKITPAVFGVWMRLLGANEGSVLWLRHANEAASANLRREAEARGISSQRLIFAPRTASAADHLARYRVADLFLDTLPYNAHATATDALWAGLPVLTCMGSTFASRVAASLLKAAGLPELITNSLQEYEAMALALASDPRRLALLKEKLAHNHSTSPLFDTAWFTRHLEAAYQTMWERHQRGYPPDHIRVAQSAAAAQAA